MDAIENTWRHLCISDEEDESIKVTFNTEARWLSMLGLSDNPPTSIKVASVVLETTLAQAWLTETVLAIRVLSHNRFALLLFSEGGTKFWMGIQLAKPPYSCDSGSRMGHAAKDGSDVGEVKRAEAAAQYGLWFHALMAGRRPQNERDGAWVGQLIRHAIFYSKPKVFVEHACENSNTACVWGKVHDSLFKRPTTKSLFISSIVHFSYILIYLFHFFQKTKEAHYQGKPTKSFSATFAPPEPTTETAHFQHVPLGRKLAGRDIRWSPIQKKAAHFNTPTAHALQAWAWSSGRSGGFGLWWKRVTCSRMYFSYLYFLGVVSLNVVCFEVFRWISGLLLDSDESDRDLPPQCFSESIDPSVDGCTRQRSLKGGRAEALDANGEILSLWGIDDYMTFLVLRLYFDIYCNRLFYV